MTAVPEFDPFKGMPRRVQIGAFVFRLKVVERADPLLDGADGLSDLGKFRIYLHPELDQRIAEVVQHELSHCINWVYGIEDGATEEQFTTQHSKGLTELWLRNPRLHNWFTKTLRRLRSEATKD